MAAWVDRARDFERGRHCMCVFPASAAVINHECVNDNTPLSILMDRILDHAARDQADSRGATLRMRDF